MKSLLISAISCFLLLGLFSCQKNASYNDILVTSMELFVDKSRPGYEICEGFALVQKSVAEFFSLAEEVGSYQFNQAAVILPCKYKGTMTWQGEQLSWEIIAGGAGRLYRSGEVVRRFLCRQRCCQLVSELC